LRGKHRRCGSQERKECRKKGIGKHGRQNEGGDDKTEKANPGREKGRNCLAVLEAKNPEEKNRGVTERKGRGPGKTTRGFKKT